MIKPNINVLFIESNSIRLSGAHAIVTKTLPEGKGGGESRGNGGGILVLLADRVLGCHLIDHHISSSDFVVPCN